MRVPRVASWIACAAVVLTFVVLVSGCSPKGAPKKSKPQKPADTGVEKPTTEPTTEPTKEPATEPSTEPAKEPGTEPAQEARDEDEMVTAPVVMPPAEPATEPPAPPTTEPVTPPTTEPATPPTTEPVTPPTEPAKEMTTEPAPPTVEPPAQPVAPPVTEPAKEMPAEPAAAPAATEPPPAAVVTVTVPLGLPAVAVPENNPMTAEKIELGKMLFFDKRLSKDGTISCATCHDPKTAWAEPHATSTGINGQVGGANAPTVCNAAYATEQFWDGRAKTLEDQALGPIENPIEMGHKLTDLVPQLNAIPGYQERFQKVFGTDVTSEGIAKAIAAFERTVLSGNSPYDKYVAGDTAALNEAQIRGLKLFEDVGCKTCHTPPEFSKYKYYNAGIGSKKETPDAGRKAVSKDDADMGKFRVPSLREVANTGPYFHDGSCATLPEAVALMAGGGADNPNLSALLKGVRDKSVTDEQKADIVEFLKALNGEYPIMEPPALP